MDFKVNDIGEAAVKIKTPSKMKIGYQPITDSERLITNANMSIVGIAGKLKVTLTYKTLSQLELNIILGQTWDIFKVNLTMVRELTFPSPDGEKVITCYFAPLDIEYLPQGNSVTPDTIRWSNLILTFIEI